MNVEIFCPSAFYVTNSYTRPSGRLVVWLYYGINSAENTLKYLKVSDSEIAVGICPHNYLVTRRDTRELPGVYPHPLAGFSSHSQDRHNNASQAV